MEGGGEGEGQDQLTYIAKRESIASLKLTLKHTFTEKLSHLNLAELAACMCVSVGGYQMTCNPSRLSSMCFSLFYTHTHSQTQ